MRHDRHRKRRARRLCDWARANLPKTTARHRRVDVVHMVGCLPPRVLTRRRMMSAATFDTLARIDDLLGDLVPNAP